MSIVRGVCGASLALSCVSWLAGPPARGADEPAAKPAATVKVERGPIRVEATLKGVVEAEQAAEVAIRPEAWASPLTVKKAVEHGTIVKKGDVLVELDTEKIDQAIKDLKLERALGALALEEAERELPVLERILPLDLAAAERARRQADEDLAKFLEVDRPQAETMAEFQVKSTRHYLEYAREELDQLQKMYRSKDLTEDTEEMILKRQRHQVESAEFQLRNAQIQRDSTIKVDLPRQEQRAREAAVRQALGLEKSRVALPLTLGQKRLALAKLKAEAERGAERLADLEKDREAMTVRAPADGIVYYGQAVGGHWAGAPAVAAKLRRGGVLQPEEVFITVVKARPVFIRATVDEKDLHALRVDLKGKATTAGYPDLVLPARLTRVSSVPQGPGSFEARVAVDLDKDDDADLVTPGMACTVKFVPYRKDDALTLPASAVFADDGDDHHVYVPVKGGKPEKKAVKVGKSAGGKTEILDGLREGDEVLATRP